MTALAVRHIGGDRELTAAARLHADDALVPAFDHHARAELELERLVAIARGIELRAVEQRARVVHLHAVARLGGRALAHLEILLEELRDGGCARGRSGRAR